jgi:hypothetical protein
MLSVWAHVAATGREFNSFLRTGIFNRRRSKAGGMPDGVAATPPSQRVKAPPRCPTQRCLVTKANEGTNEW